MEPPGAPSSSIAAANQQLIAVGSGLGHKVVVSEDYQLTIEIPSESILEASLVRCELDAARARETRGDAGGKDMVEKLPNQDVGLNFGRIYDADGHLHVVDCLEVGSVLHSVQICDLDDLLGKTSPLLSILELCVFLGHTSTSIPMLEMRPHSTHSTYSTHF